MSNILEVCNLTKSYDTFSLKSVSFEIPTGYIMGFIGPNGSGKTTTIKSILNLIRFSEGEIKLFGASLSGNLAKINDRIGVVMDIPFYSDDWTPEVIESAISPFYTYWDSQKYKKLLADFKIDNNKKVKELSRGMKVKLMLAVALSHDAKFLILDEPTSGLDPVARDEICSLLSDFISDGTKSILFSTHITSDLEKIADYITFILDGCVVFSGLKDELLEKYASVKGAIQEITSDQKQLIFGLKEHETGFEGMIETKDIGKFSKTMMIEPISLEEIIIFMNKEGGSL